MYRLGTFVEHRTKTVHVIVMQSTKPTVSICCCHQGPTMPPPGFKVPAAKPAATGSNVNAAAAARVAASIAILTSHSVPMSGDQGEAVEQQQEQQQQWDGDDGDAGGWVPPSDQTGDGKTSLNAKYGY